MNLMDGLCKTITALFETAEREEKKDWSDRAVLDRAWRDWFWAQRIFEQTGDFELVDYAVYNLLAAEKKYSYLLKRLRAKNMDNNNTSSLMQANNS